MNNSFDSKKLIEDINENSSRLIKNYFELTVLSEIAFNNDRSDEFDKLIFKAKYVKGLKSVLANRTVTGDDYMEKIFVEFNQSVRNVIELLKELTENSDEKVKMFFNEKYFKLTQESMVNVMELIEDLSLCKEYFNRFPKKK